LTLNRKDNPVPTYHIETLQRWPRRVVYEFEAKDMPTALGMVLGGLVEHREQEVLEGEGEIVEFISAERIDGDPIPQPKQI
jgi:hypothetical protein